MALESCDESVFDSPPEVRLLAFEGDEE